MFPPIANLLVLGTRLKVNGIAHIVTDVMAKQNEQYDEISAQLNFSQIWRILSNKNKGQKILKSPNVALCIGLMMHEK